MESEVTNYLLTNSVRGLALLATINLAGFVSSLENVNNPMKYGLGKEKEVDESRFNKTKLGNVIRFVSKPGRSLAYLISKK